jgi:hypothetical protein
MPGNARPGPRRLRVITVPEGTPYRVLLSVPRVGGWREWGAVSGGFEARLSEPQDPAVIGAHIDSEIRRGRDYVRVTVSMAVVAPDVAEALSLAWGAFLEAAGDDVAGWDADGATAEVRPE